MKILIDLHALQGRSAARGIGRYSENLVKAFKNSDDVDVHFLISASSEFAKAPDLFSLMNGITTRSKIHVLPNLNGLNQTEATYIREAFIFALKIDLLLVTDLFEAQNHFPCSINEFFDIPTAVILYDLIPLDNPEEHFLSPGSKKVYDYALLQLQRASLIFCISEFTKQSLLSHFPSITSKLFVIGGGTTLQATTKKRHSKNLVTVGGDHPRKNIKNLILAWGKLPANARNNCQLIIVGNFSKGSLSNFSSLIRVEGISENEIVFVGHIPDIDLTYLIENSIGLVHPAFNEGLGLPILEAINLGVPALCSNTTSMLEIGQVGAVIDPANVVQFAQVLSDFITSEDFRNQILRSQTSVRTKFTWDHSVNILLSEVKNFLSTRRQDVLQYKTLLVVAPGTNKKTGIARYAQSTGDALSAYYDIKYIDPSDINFNYNFMRFLDSFDNILIHLGNSEHHNNSFILAMIYPATIFLHETSLSDTINRIEVNKKIKSLLTGDTTDSIFTNEYWLKKLLALSSGVIVHSENSKSFLTKMQAGNTLPDVIQHPFLGSPKPSKPKKITKKITRIGTVGFANRNKNIELLIESVSLFNSQYSRDLTLEVLGESNPEYLGFIHLLAKKQKVNIEVTGYLTLEELHDRISQLDVAVQLRNSDSGENSGTIADLVHFHVPTVINNMGPFAHLDSEVFHKLEAKPTVEELVSAIVFLDDEDNRVALIDEMTVYSQDQTSLDLWAKKVSKMIELKGSKNFLAIARKGLDFEIENTANFAKSLFESHVEIRKFDVVYLASDISNFYSTNFVTGIQRVALELHAGIRKIVSDTDRVLIGINFNQSDDLSSRSHNNQISAEIELLTNSVPFYNIGVLLLIDLDFHFLSDENLRNFKAQNVLICSMVYDILPLEHPEWFPAGTDENLFFPWLKMICDYSDVIFVNSESVKSRLVELDLFGERAVEIHVVRLGSFIEARNLSNVRSSREVLVVATIEPRKGYSEILDAFDNLIKKGFNPIIHIVGRQGWMTENIIKRIENHKLAGVNLIWHKEITDEKLLELYLKVGATIASSYAEGFGLPIIESLSVKCPVIARNIPVFKELDTDNIHYFENGYPSLTEVWENLLKGKIEWRGVHNLGEEQFSYTFENSSQKIMSIINSKF